MNNVTLAANVMSEPIDGGMRFDVTGEGAAHAANKVLSFVRVVRERGL
jgi:ribose 5-phosphate isomerase RpiB